MSLCSSIFTGERIIQRQVYVFFMDLAFYGREAKEYCCVFLPYTLGLFHAGNAYKDLSFTNCFTLPQNMNL